jgi:hypothetical protein
VLVSIRDDVNPAAKNVGGSNGVVEGGTYVLRGTYRPMVMVICGGPLIEGSETRRFQCVSFFLLCCNGTLTTYNKYDMPHVCHKWFSVTSYPWSVINCSFFFSLSFRLTGQVL